MANSLIADADAGWSLPVDSCTCVVCGFEHNISKLNNKHIWILIINKSVYYLNNIQTFYIYNYSNSKYRIVIINCLMERI
jgi:hypothetical protein